MSNEYTPHTGQVRAFWASEGTHAPAAKSQDYVESAAEFDRWMEQELRAAKAEAWQEGFIKSGRLLTGLDTDPWPPVPNPYEAEGDQS